MSQFGYDNELIFSLIANAIAYCLSLSVCLTFYESKLAHKAISWSLN